MLSNQANGACLGNTSSAWHSYRFRTLIYLVFVGRESQIRMAFSQNRLVEIQFSLQAHLRVDSETMTSVRLSSDNQINDVILFGINLQILM